MANKQVLRLAHSKCLKSHSCASGMPSTWPSFFSELSYKFRCMVSSQVFKNIFKDSTETDQNRWSYCLKSHSCASGMPSTWPSFFSELSYTFRCMVASQVLEKLQGFNRNGSKQVVSTENLKRATYSDITLRSLSCSRSASTGTISGSWSGTIIGSWSGSQRFVANKQVLSLAHSKFLKSHSCASCGMP